MPITPCSPRREERANVEINVGKRCNNRCVFCLNSDAEKAASVFMPFDALEAEIRRWAAAGYHAIGFLGGEPTVYPRIVEAVACARAHGFDRIAIATNATRLHDPALADRLIAAGLTRVTISMHGHTPQLEDALTSVPGNFAKKCAAIAHLLRRRGEGELRDGVSVNLVLNALNAPHLLRIQQFFFDGLAIDDLRVNFIRSEGNAAGSRELTPRLSAIVPLVAKAVVLNEAHYRRTFTVGGLPFCVLPQAMLSDPALLRRTIGECRDLPTDCSIEEDGPGPGVSLADGRARFNWRRRQRDQLKSQVAACRRCALGGVCDGLWNGYLEIHGADELAPIGSSRLAHELLHG